jgi:hypothetical protein
VAADEQEVVYANQQEVYALSRGAAHFGCTNTRFTDSANSNKRAFRRSHLLEMLFFNLAQRHNWITHRFERFCSRRIFSLSEPNLKSDSELLDGLKDEMLNSLRL